MKVSICIPTYNQAVYLEKAILSATQQSLVPFEIIVSDDCSTDNTPEVLKNLMVGIPYLKVLRQEKNLGIAKNTDICLRQATGDFIVRLDSDDYLRPSYTEKLANLLLQFRDAGYAHADVQEIDQESRMLNTRKLFRKPGYQSADEALKASINGYRVAANIIMFRREALEKVGFITGRPDYVEDFHLSTSLSASGFGNVYINEVLSNYRVWIDSGKVRQRRKLLEINGLTRVFTEVIEPAFEKRNWNVSPIHTKRTLFACTQSDCLGWDVYSKSEKEELVNALTKLSPSSRTKVFIWLYLRGFGILPNSLKKISAFAKIKLKNFLLGNKNQF